VKLLWKLLLSAAVLVFLTAVVVGALATRWTEALTLQEIRRSLRHQTLTLSETVAHAPSEDELQPLVLRLRAQVETRLTVIRDDGLVLADSERPPAELDNHADRPEVIQAMAEEVGASTRFSDSLGTRMTYSARAIKGRAGRRLVVRAALPLSLLDERLRRVRDAVLLGSALGFLVSLLPAVWIARRISRPLEEVTAVAQSFAGGDYTARVADPGPGDEIGNLAAGFNSMADQLRSRVETIDSDRLKLRAILASMTEGLVAVDADQRILHMNEVAGQLLETDPETSIGLQLRDVTRMSSVCEVLATTLESGEPTTEEVTLSARPRDRILELHAAPLRGADPARPPGALVVIHDMTELRRLEAVRRDFVGNVSHELKTPLTAIRAQIETLLDTPDESVTPEERRRFLERANAQTDRLTTIVRDLLVLSRIESERSGFESSPLDLAGPVNESVRGLESLAKEKGVSVEVALPEAPASVVGDREYLRQVVDNLLSNAIMYTPTGGEIRLELRLDPRHVGLDVTDNGIGIAPEDRKRIFERFYRVHKGRSRQLGGTGLGLAIVKHITQAHGGEVLVRSTLGEGTTFSVHLPHAPPGEEAPQDPL
jgi:two-component system, OmpR family, phosphate regulon sensor histidine kinase PhoR